MKNTPTPHSHTLHPHHTPYTRTLTPTPFTLQIEEEHKLKREIPGTKDSLEIIVLDTSGQENFANLRARWFSWADIYIIMYNMGDLSSLDQAQSFYNQLKDAKFAGTKPKQQQLVSLPGANDLCIVLCATGSDLDSSREVSKHQGEDLSAEWGCPYVEVSAFNGNNVEKCLQLCIEQWNMNASQRETQQKSRRSILDQKVKVQEEFDESRDRKEERAKWVREKLQTSSSVLENEMKGNLSRLAEGKFKQRFYELRNHVLTEYDREGGKVLTVFKVTPKTSFSEYQKDPEHLSFVCDIPTSNNPEKSSSSLQLIFKADNLEEMTLWLNSFLKQTLEPELVKSITQNEEYAQLMQTASFSRGSGFSVEEYGISYETNRRYRPSMEDEHTAMDMFGGDQNSGFFAIYDGHGGVRSAKFVEKALPKELLKRTPLPTKPDDVLDWLRKGFLAVDEQLCNELKVGIDDSGCTAAVAYLTWNGNDHMLYTANVGDSRVVLCQGSQATRLTIDHNAKTCPEEIKRVSDQNGYIVHDKVMGMLSVTRAFGDYGLKQWVHADPHMTQTVLQHTTEPIFVIIACDGLWDVVSDEEAAQLLQKERSCKDMSHKLLYTALSKGTKDNVSIMVLRLTSQRNRAESLWSGLTTHLDTHIKNKYYEKEWEALETREVKRSPALFSIGNQTFNRDKNRYQNIIPLDKHRVVLQQEDQKPGSDYINASWITMDKITYIASAAPMPNSFYDFYRMIWECNIPVVVMLTKIME